MIIKKIGLNNFTSFYGKHVLQLQKGVNVVVGPCGSGKTNLTRAFRFAVFGYVDIPRKRLINFKHMQECLEKKSRNPSCEVKVEVQLKDRESLFQSRFSLIGEKEIRQVSTVDSDVDNLITSESFKHIYLNPLNLEFEEHRDDSMANRITFAVIKHLNLNVEAGIKMAILDGILECLTVDYKEKLLSFIDELAIEQVTIMSSWFPRDLEDHPFRIHNIELDKENCSKIVK